MGVPVGKPASGMPYAAAPPTDIRRGARAGRRSATRAAAALAAVAERGPAAALEAVRGELRAARREVLPVNGDAEFLVDPVPRVLTAAEWEPLERGLAQRAMALTASWPTPTARARSWAGVMEERVIADAPRPRGDAARRSRRPAASGSAWRARHRARSVRGVPGARGQPDDAERRRLRGRRARRRRSPRSSPRERPRTLDGAAELLRRGAARVAPVEQPQLVVLTDGPERRALGARWAAEQPRHPARRAGRPGAARRSPAPRPRGRRRLPPHEPTGSTRTRAPAARRALGTLGVVNAFGAGLADDKLAHAYVEDMVRFYLGEEPLLRSVPTLDLARPEHRERALDEAAELVLKPREGYGGVGVVIGPHADAADVEAVRRRVARTRAPTSPSRS